MEAPLTAVARRVAASVQPRPSSRVNHPSPLLYLLHPPVPRPAGGMGHPPTATTSLALGLHRGRRYPPPPPCLALL